MWAMDYLNAFWVGGLICALVQILMEKTKLMPGRIMVLLVCSGAVLSALGWYQPFVDFAGAGASVPLLGFGHTLMKGVKEAVEQDGFLGLFTGGFQAWFCPTARPVFYRRQRKKRRFRSSGGWRSRHILWSGPAPEPVPVLKTDLRPS